MTSQRSSDPDCPYVIPSPEPPVAPIFPNAARRAAMDRYIEEQRAELARTHADRRRAALSAESRLQEEK